MPHKIFNSSFLQFQKEKYEEINLIKKEFDLKGAALLSHIDLLPFATCVSNSDGYFIDVNRKYSQLTGYKKEELIGSHATQVIMEMTESEISDFYDQFWRTEHHPKIKHHLRAKNGDILTVISNASKIKDNGTLKKITFVEDITGWNKTQVEMLKKVEEINNYLEIQKRALEVAMHDIKNYVSNITLSSEMLLDEITNANQKTYLQLIYKNSKAIDTHLSELSRIIRIENGNYDTEISKFNVKDALENIIEEFEDLIRMKKLKINIDYDKSKPLHLHTDIFCFNSSIKNLIKNAIEASPKSKQITINLRSEYELQIKIHNYGTIPLEIQDRFFHKYVSGQMKNNGENNKGSGLGTYIAKKMIDQIDGCISFTSDIKDGTTIYINLPISLNPSH